MRNLGLASVVLLCVACEGRMHSLGGIHRDLPRAGASNDDGETSSTAGRVGALGGRSGLGAAVMSGMGGFGARGGSSGGDETGGTGATGDAGASVDAGASGCGNRAIEPLEECDDGNTTAGDGCTAQCTVEAAPVEVGGARCALSSAGTVKCWGDASLGSLGLGDAENRGDNAREMGEALPALNLGTGRRASAVSAGSNSACALLDDGSLKCWGDNREGQLGFGHTESLGDDLAEMGDSLPAVDLGVGRRATAVVAGGFHTCALLDDGSMKCWGFNGWGQLGLGDNEARGDDPGEMGDSLPAVDLGVGRRATAIAAGGFHTCALLDDGSVKCWGDNRAGQLGLGDTRLRGNEPLAMGDELPVVDLGSGRFATAIAVSINHTCALLDDSSVKCWGANDQGQLGRGDTENRGDEPGEMGDSLPAVDLGSGYSAGAIAAGAWFTCALLEERAVKCWGQNWAGQLGIGETEDRGDDPAEMGDALPSVNLGVGRNARRISPGSRGACILLDDSSVKCWGDNQWGTLGLGDTEARGDDPGEMGDDLPPVELGF